MKSVGVFEGKTRFSALIADALKGETTLITRNGKPVAEVGPVRDERVTRAKKAAIHLRAMHTRLAAEGRLKGISIRELIDEGRR